jgi:AraC family transcriptional regulator
MKEQIEAVRRMQEHIAAHLREEITLADLAAASRYSPWYAHRLFVKWLNRTPAAYIRRLRLSESALTLRDGNRTVTDVAFSHGFGSVDGYQRAFNREFGLNPREYALDPVPLYLFTPYGVQETDEEQEERKVMERTVQTVFVRPVTKPARRALIQRGKTAADYYKYCEEVGCEIWGLLKSIPNTLAGPVGMWLPKRYVKAGTSEYVQGVEMAADYAGVTPEGLDAIDLPAATYLAFQGEPFAEEDYEEAITQVWEAIKRFNPETAGFEWDTANPRIQTEPVGSCGYLELVPVKPLKRL